MSTEPLITTIIPTYRRPLMLRRAIKSVLDQTYPHVSIFVSDNASNDETAEVVKAMQSCDGRIRYHCHSTNIGSQDNFIYGLSQVNTPFVHMLSDDDFLLPDFFAQATHALTNHPGAAFFSGGLLSADPDGSVRALVRYGSDVPQPYRSPRLFQLLAPHTRTWTTALFRRADLDTVGGLKKETGYAFPIDLILRLATRFGAVLSDAPCGVFTVHSGSISVEEVSEAFTATFDLGFFDSINQAIDEAIEDRIVTTHDAAQMKAVFRSTAVNNLIYGAVASIARGHIAIALKASEVLVRDFQRRDMAMMIAVAALDNGLGALVRLALRAVKATRKLRYARNNGVQYAAYSEVVQHRMSQLVG